MSRRWQTLTGLVVAALFVATAPVSQPSAAQQVAFEEIHRPNRAGGSISARLVAPVWVTTKPGGGQVVTRLSTETSWSRRQQSLMVLDSALNKGQQWIKVLLPIRPNGSAGWIPRNRAVLRKNQFWIEIRKWNRRVVVFRQGKKVAEFRTVIGAARTPTPAGLAAIYEKNRQRDVKGFIGPWALSLTALSRTLKSYGGGPGRIAIHGRGGASFADPLGSAASNGCLRIPNRAVRWLARNISAGTPVLIRNR